MRLTMNEAVAMYFVVSVTNAINVLVGYGLYCIGKKLTSIGAKRGREDLVKEDGEPPLQRRRLNDKDDEEAYAVLDCPEGGSLNGPDTKDDHTELEEEEEEAKAKLAFVKPFFGFVEVVTKDDHISVKWPAIFYSVNQNIRLSPHLQLLDSISTETTGHVKVTRCHQVDRDGRVEVVNSPEASAPSHSTVRLLGGQQLISNFVDIDWKFMELDDLDTVFDDCNVRNVVFRHLIHLRSSYHLRGVAYLKLFKKYYLASVCDKNEAECNPGAKPDSLEWDIALIQKKHKLAFDYKNF